MQQLKKRTILITGSNRGLGYTLAEQICKKNPLKLDIILAARSQNSGYQALQKLQKQYPQQNLSFEELEIGNNKSHEKFFNSLKSKQQSIDVLVNNAGIMFSAKDDSISDLEKIERTLNINYFGTIEFTKKMLPFITDDAKIITMGSGLGTLNCQSTYLKEQLSKENISEARLKELADEFIEVAKQNKFSDKTFNNLPYNVSKGLLQIWGNQVGQNLLKPNQNLFLVCPGWCQTEMGGQEATNTAEEGVSYQLKLINEYPFKRCGSSGHLFSYGKKIGP